MEILKFDYDVDSGFAMILVSGKQTDDQMIVQCCLKTGDYDAERDCGKPIPFLLKIDEGNCGHNDGICGDVNAPAFEYWGENRCMKALYAKAKANGIDLS